MKQKAKVYLYVQHNGHFHLKNGQLLYFCMHNLLVIFFWQQCSQLLYSIVDVVSPSSLNCKQIILTIFQHSRPNTAQHHKHTNTHTQHTHTHNTHTHTFPLAKLKHHPFFDLKGNGWKGKQKMIKKLNDFYQQGAPKILPD